MAKFELQPGEQLLKQENLSYLKSRMNMVQGGGFLTDRRFVHTNKMKAIATGGLIGAAFAKGKVDIDVPLGAITSFSRDSHGRNNSVLKVTTADGQEYRLMPDSFDEWLQAFGDVLATYHGTKLVEYQQGIWTVLRV